MTMLSNETVRKLHEMRLGVMAEAFSAQLADAQFQSVSFAEVPIMEHSQLSGHIVAAMEVSGVRIQVYEGADGATLQAILQAAKSC